MKLSELMKDKVPGEVKVSHDPARLSYFVPYYRIKDTWYGIYYHVDGYYAHSEQHEYENWEPT